VRGGTHLRGGVRHRGKEANLTVFFWPGRGGGNRHWTEGKEEKKKSCRRPGAARDHLRTITFRGRERRVSDHFYAKKKRNTSHYVHDELYREEGLLLLSLPADGKEVKNNPGISILPGTREGTIPFPSPEKGYDSSGKKMENAPTLRSDGER